jgi:DNA-binding protein HU-beta
MASLNKTDLAGEVAGESGLDNSEAKKAVEATFAVIAKHLAAGDEVSVGGFGKFSVTQRSARQGRNPQTGETIQIAASKAPKFSAASALKNDVKS